MPHCIDAELSVIGSLLLESSAIDRVSNILLSGSFFYDERHRIIYDVIQSIDNEGRKPDIIIISEEIGKLGNIDIVGLDYITDLYSSAISSVNVEEHASMIRDCYLRRQMIESGLRTISQAYDDTQESFSILSNTDTDIQNIMAEAIGRDQTEDLQIILGKALDSLYERIEKRKNNQMSGIPTGLKELDKYTNGWQDSDLVILAARPAMGKTAFALHTAKAAAINGKYVVLFNLEMNQVQLVNRMILSETSVHPNRFNAGNLINDEIVNIEKAINSLYNLNISIDGNTDVTMSYIRNKCRLLKKKGQCAMIIIDYLQLVSSSSDKNRTREQEVSQISREAKLMAKELNVPVLLLSQLNRDVDKRQSKKPLLSDLRESGSIEQDADIVIFIHRPGYYDRANEELKGYGELIISKYRNGNPGEIPFRYNDSLTQIFDINDTLPF